LASLTLLDVGHGGCALLESDGERVLVDAGPGTSCLELLRERTIGGVSLVLLSHADADHVKGLVSLIGTDLEVGTVLLNTDSLKGTKIWEALLWELDQRRRRGETQFEVALVEGFELRPGGEGIGLTVLAPRRYLAGLGPGAVEKGGRRIETNSVSAVVRIARDGEPLILLTGDLDSLGLEYLLAGGIDIKARVLVYPHHGARSDNDTREFARELITHVRPEIVVFSIGRGRFGTPRPEIIETILDANPEVRIACTQLSEHCADTLPLEEPTHLSKSFSAGRRGRKCCAGTITFTLGDGLVEPSADLHRAFIRRWALTALCQKIPVAL
jgi:competence protein ComEC